MEFRWLSRGKHLESQWNFDGTPLEYHRNTAADFVQIYRMFSRLFQWNTTHFLAERTGIFMKFLWYFDGIFVVFSRIWMVFSWNFGGILMEFQSKKQYERSYLQNYQYFCRIFHVFSHLAIPQKSMEKCLHCQNLTGILMETSLNLHC